MQDFNFQCKTELIFGKGTEQKAGSETARYSDNILLVYGGGSIKKTGLFEKVTKSLIENKIKYTELSGVKPNPELGLVHEGIKICREKNIGFILAVGGGSVIDTAKAIAMGFYYEGDVWDFFSGKSQPEKALPIGTVLTLAAAGSEASQSTVITNENGRIKKGFNCNLSRPSFSIMNPELTYTLPTHQTFYGIIDMMSHVHERFFTNVENNDLTDLLSVAVLKTIIKNALILIDNPNDYDARSQIMLSGTFAHNDLTGMGRIGDFATHNIEHELSAFYGVIHGAGIAVISIAWMKFVYEKKLSIFAQYAREVWNVSAEFGNEKDIASEGIKRFKAFIQKIDVPVNLQELGLPQNISENFHFMAEKCAGDKTLGNLVKINMNDVIKIFEIADME
ncbi:MAG: iron-containing alcohol dehydrogenase [Spirochaetaceae bacterium]|nr:iron-containing alcohol dehydrogenase [Spirochaetaceae bacterium]